jgi:hypothetical protein
VVACLPVLTFDALGNGPSAMSFLTPVFRRAMAWLCGRGLRTLDLVEAVDWLERGVFFLKRSLVVTFEDSQDGIC